MKVTETTDKGRRKVVAVNDGEAPLRFRVEIIDEGLADWLAPSSLSRSRELTGAARALFAVAAGAWKAFRAGVPSGHLDGEAAGGMVPPEMRSGDRSWTAQSSYGIGAVLVGPNAAGVGAE
ncbi:MAG TPA: hypothetical protein VGE38_16840 [Nocardioides sp.]|uniref:hypothetical protein n=1 Tax=Nocardioides sp. TaxID=35761 RepID=UPI002EDAB530